MRKIEEVKKVEEVKEVKEVKEVNKSKGKEEVKVATQKPAIPKKVEALLKDMPDKVTPKHIDEAFQFNDGGKTVRRHLRNKFSANHKHKEAWEWAKGDKTLTAILIYFADKYEIPQKREKAAK